MLVSADPWLTTTSAVERLFIVICAVAPDANNPVTEAVNIALGKSELSAEKSIVVSVLVAETAPNLIIKPLERVTVLMVPEILDGFAKAVPIAVTTDDPTNAVGAVPAPAILPIIVLLATG